MLFSVIVPVYNVEKYLGECVDSILKQTYGDFEIILVDDGSTDNSPAICDEFAEKDSRVKVIHKKNGGLSDARNAGTKIASGEYIIYIDSDDFITSDTFMGNIEKKLPSDPDLVFYKYARFYDRKKELVDCSFSYKRAMNAKDYASKIRTLVEDDSFYGMAWIKAIKRSLIEDNDIHFEVGLLGEDMEWNYHIVYAAQNVEFVDEAYIAYRQREGSISQSLKLKNLTDFLYVLEKWSEKIKRSQKDDEFKNALYGSLAKYYSNMLVVYSRVNDKAKKEYKQRIKALSWLLKYSMSKRPQLVSKIYSVFGFDMTILALKILDKVK